MKPDHSLDIRKKNLGALKVIREVIAWHLSFVSVSKKRENLEIKNNRNGYRL